MTREDLVLLIIVAVIIGTLALARSKYNYVSHNTTVVEEVEPECNKTRPLDSVTTVGTPYGL